jgi:hypothetical protein
MLTARITYYYCPAKPLEPAMLRNRLPDFSASRGMFIYGKMIMMTTRVSALMYMHAFVSYRVLPVRDDALTQATANFSSDTGILGLFPAFYR